MVKINSKHVIKQIAATIKSPQHSALPSNINNLLAISSNTKRTTEIDNTYSKIYRYDAR